MFERERSLYIEKLRVAIINKASVWWNCTGKKVGVTLNIKPFNPQGLSVT